MNYIQYMKPGSKFWALPNGLEDVSWSEFLNNWKQAIEKAKDQIIDKWENLKQDYKDAADPITASERRQAESIEATRAKQASMKFVSDNRTDYEKKRDRKNFELKEFEQKEQQNKDATDAVMWTLTGIPYAMQHLASPNGVIKTYGNTKAAVQNGGGPYIEKTVASAAGDVLDATILAAPLFTPEARLARAMNKNIRNATLQPTVADEAILRGQLGWAPKQTIPYRHGSLDPELKTFVPKHNRWDVVTHGADPNMYFVTDQSTPVSAANMMDLRPYQYTGSIIAEKPMVQIGDFNIAGKNVTRNQLIARARQQGADTYLLQDIVDNKVPHLNIVARFIGPEGEAVQGGTLLQTKTPPTKTSLAFFERLPVKISEAERLGIPKGERNIKLHGLKLEFISDDEINNKLAENFYRQESHELGPKLYKEPTLQELEEIKLLSDEFGIPKPDQIAFFEQYPNNLNVLIHIDDRLPLTVTNTGFKPLPASNYHGIGTIQEGTKPYIWWNRNFPYYRPSDQLIPKGHLLKIKEGSIKIQRPPYQTYDNSVVVSEGIIPYENLKGLKWNADQSWFEREIFMPARKESDYFKRAPGWTLFKSGGSIKIKKKNKGKFTASAKAAGEGVQEHAHKVMNDPDATPLQKKRANFAWVARHKFKHEEGGVINYLNIF